MTSPARTFRWGDRTKRAAEMRAEGKAWPTVAEATGYALGTVRNFALVPEFMARVNAISDGVIEDAQRYLSAHALEAAQTVVDVMRTGEAKRDEPRLAAAQDILDRMGVQARADAAAPAEPAISVTVNHNAVYIAERAYLAALRGEPPLLGAALYPPDPSDQGPDGLSALRLSSGVPDGPEPGPHRAQGAPDGHEPDRGH